MRRLLGSFTLAAVVVLAAAGCGGGDKSEGDDSSKAQTIEIPGQGVSFELPDDWDAIAAKDVADASTDSDVFADLADRMGIEPEQLTQQLANLDLFVGAPHAEGGVLSNVNALHFEVADLPSADTFELQFRSLGATDIETTEVSTEVGDGYRVSYSLTLKGNAMVGTALIIDHGSSILDITVTSSTSDLTETLADQVVGSLAVTD